MFSLNSKHVFFTMIKSLDLQCFVILICTFLLLVYYIKIDVDFILDDMYADLFLLTAMMYKSILYTQL